MSAHSQASPESQALCDRLVATLTQTVPDLQRSSKQVSCGLFRRDCTRFAYQDHQRSASDTPRGERL